MARQLLLRTSLLKSTAPLCANGSILISESNQQLNQLSKHCTHNFQIKIGGFVYDFFVCLSLVFLLFFGFCIQQGKIDMRLVVCNVLCTLLHRLGNILSAANSFEISDFFFPSWLGQTEYSLHAHHHKNAKYIASAYAPLTPNAHIHTNKAIEQFESLMSFPLYFFFYVLSDFMSFLSIFFIFCAQRPKKTLI